MAERYETFIEEAMDPQSNLSADGEDMTPPMKPVSLTYLLSIEAEINFATEADTKNRCTICLNDYAVLDPTTVLPCDHSFHKACLSNWLSVKKSCPLCRKGFDAPKRLPRRPQTDSLSRTPRYVEMRTRWPGSWSYRSASAQQLEPAPNAGPPVPPMPPLV